MRRVAVNTRTIWGGSAPPSVLQFWKVNPGMGMMDIRCMATKKAVGSTKNGRDSNPKYLGVKTFGGHFVKPGNILVRQRGTEYWPGQNVFMGKDHTLHALRYGHVRFQYGNVRKNKLFVHVDPLDVDEALLKELSPKTSFPVAKPAIDVSTLLRRRPTKESQPKQSVKG